MTFEEICRQSQLRRLDKWILWTIVAEAFLIPLFPEAAKVALLLGIGLTAWKKYKVKEMKFRQLPFDVPVTIFVVLGAVSILVSPDCGFSFYNYYNLVGVYALTYLLVGQNVSNTEQLKKIAAAMCLSALFVVLYGYFQYVFGIDTSEMRWVDGEAFPELRKRVFSTWENPNILAGYLDMTICIALGVFVKCANRVQRIFLLCVMMMMAACLAMTYARGACLTIAVILAVYGMFKDWRILLFCVLAGGAMLLFDAALYERLTSVFTKVDTSAEMRLAFWEATIAMIQDHPFLGIGWGAYWMVYPKYDFYMQGEYIKIVHAHNVYLNYMAEIGIAGGGAFFWYFFGTMFKSLRARIFPKPEAAGAIEETGAKEEVASAEGLMESATAPLEAEQKAAKEQEEACETVEEAEQEESTKAITEETLQEKPEPSAMDEDSEEKPVVSEIERDSKEKQKASETVTEEKEEKGVSSTAPRKEPRENEEAVKALEAVRKEFETEDAALHEQGSIASVDIRAELSSWDALSLRAGVVLGIGLAFVSVALNGITDDVLFNIPTSMFFWMLAALSMTCIGMEENSSPNMKAVSLERVED